MAAAKTRQPVMGRLFWDPTHPSPWMSFPNITAYRNWAKDIRKARPGTKTEYAYYDMVWTADAMLSSVQWDAKEQAAYDALNAANGLMSA